MSGPTSLKSLVCEEVFDERSQPSEEEVREFAVKIGIDPDVEPHLVPLARDGLLKPLPKNWKPVYDPHTKEYYYFNFKTRQSSWEHPLDNKFRELVKKSRSESLSSAGEEDSKTSIKEELKSFEETAASLGLESDISACTKDNLMDFPSQRGRLGSAHSSLPINPLIPSLKSALSPVRSTKKGNQENLFPTKQTGKLASVKNDLKPVVTPKPLFSSNLKKESKNYTVSQSKRTKADWNDSSFYLDDNSEHMKDLRNPGGDSKYLMSLESSIHDESLDSPSSSVIGRFTVDRVHKIDIDSQSKRLDSDSAKTIHRTSDRFSKIGLGQSELTLSGGGSVFLKSNRKNSEEKEPGELTEMRSSYGHTSENVGVLKEITSSLKSYESNSLVSTRRNMKSPVQSIDTVSASSVPLTRSILRTPQGERRLWDLDPQHMSVSEKTLWKQQELEEEKKSVRFNLDKELNIMFKLSDSSGSESSSEVEDVETGEGKEEWMSSGSKDWIQEFQQLRSHRLKNTDEVQESPRAERHLSPLEEWAKKTWFSEKSSTDDKESDVIVVSMMDTSDNNSALHEKNLSGKISNVADIEKDEIEEILHGPPDTVKDTPITNLVEEVKEDNFKSQDPGSLFSADLTAISQVEPILNSLPEEDSKLSKTEEILKETSSKNNSSPVLQDRTRSETDHLLSSLNKKLESLISRDALGLEDPVAQRTRAREQAYRDWNVKHLDAEMHRPQLTRQQSQQQMQHMKQQVQEETRSSDRDRALREWSVTKGSNVSETFAKSGPMISDSEPLAEISPLFSSGLELETACNKGSKKNPPTEFQMPTDSHYNDKSFSDSIKTESINNPEMNLGVKDSALKQELNYKEHVKVTEHEYKLRFEKDQEEIVKDYEEKLQKRLEEEAQNAELKYKEAAAQLECEAAKRMKQLREQLEHKQECATQKLLEEHQKSLAAQEVENQAAMLHLREQHSADVKTLREQLQREEEQVRREHQERIMSLREDRDGKRSREITDQLRIIEKLRCEKRIVEDKYRTLKEKYVKLKGEMKANLEKKEQKHKDLRRSDEMSKQGQSIAAEQEITASQSLHQSDRSSETESRPKTVSSGSSATSSALGFQQSQYQTQHQEQLNPSLDPPPPAPNSGPSESLKNNNNDANGSNLSFLGISFTNPAFQRKLYDSNSNAHGPSQSTRHFRAAERNGNIPSTGQDDLIGYQQPKEKGGDMSPLEALRLQLRTLDELEEQFPACSVTDAYLRYPFSETGNKELGSAELEFFRHRIHLERDMIRQAKNSLQAQQSEYRSRLHNFQQRQSSSSASLSSTTLYQMAKEEQELSDMEEKLHRTRRVLSEKMIHLRQLENSLYHITAPTTRSQISNEGNAGRGNKATSSYWTEKVQSKPQRRWDWKVGTGLWGMEDVSDDLSSDSGGSSGFSSTEYTSDGTLASFFSQSGSGRKVKKMPGNSSDINLSLYNLNAEISEIWNVLCKQRAAAGLGPPPLLNTQVPGWIDTANNANVTPVATVRASSPLLTTSGSKVVPDKGTSLIERTNNLRLWLQKAKMSATLPNTSAVGDRHDVPF